MNEAPYTGDLDLESVTTLEELAERMRIVHRRADKPSLRTLEQLTRHGVTPLSRTAVSEMLNGVRSPPKAVMVAFLEVCGVQRDQMAPWLRAWERIFAPGPNPAETAETAQLREQIARLQEDNDRLRRELVHQRRTMPQPHFAGLASDEEPRDSIIRGSIWHFPDNSPITLVSYRLPSDRQPPSTNRSNLNYIHYAELADLDALVDVHGAIRAYNPTSRVVIKAAQELEGTDVVSHLVLIGGLTWKTVIPRFSPKFPIPIYAGDPADRRAIVVQDPANGEREFGYTLIGDELVEDVGFFVSGANPVDRLRSLTVCGGITTRGVLGAARCFIDREKRVQNEQYIMSRFPQGSTYCIVMRVTVVNQDPVTPDLYKQEDRLFEWHDVSAETG